MINAKTAPKNERTCDRTLDLLRAVAAVLRDREAELLALKGPCSTSRCRLHYAHSGPCDIKTSRPTP